MILGTWLFTKMRGELVGTDIEGNRYFDALSSLFCAQLGYSYGEEMATASSAQLTRLPFGTN